MKHLKPFNESNYEREKRTFSKEQANSILYDEGIYDDNGNTLYSVVESNVTYTDQEKNRVEYSIDIQGIKFGLIKPNIDHLISYMKSIRYSNFIYRDDELNFNQYNARVQNNTGRSTQQLNYLPTEENSISYGVFTFIKD